MPLDIALDIGTAYTSIFLRTEGVVLREPSVVAIVGKNKVRAVGFEAAEMLGKAPDNVRVVCPVKDGYIVDSLAATLMIRTFLAKITPPNALFYPRFRCILATPAGLTDEEVRTYERICNTAGIGEVVMADSVLMAALGVELPLTSAFGGFVVDIGGGITKIASVSMCAILSGCAISIGGDMMDKALGDYILGKFDIRLGLRTLRKIKSDIGSLYTNDTASMVVSGVDAKTHELRSLEIAASDVGEAVRPYYAKVADSIEKVIKKCPPEAAAEIHRRGINLTGGAAAIKGLDGFLHSRLKLPVIAHFDPHLAVIRGSGKLLTNKALLAEVLRGKK